MSGPDLASRLGWGVAAAWLALVPLASGASSDVPLFGVLAVGLLLLAGAVLSRSRAPDGARVLLLVLGLALIYSCVRNAAFDIPAVGGKQLRLAPARLLLLAAPIVLLSIRGKWEIGREMAGALKVLGAVLGLLTVTGVMLFLVVRGETADTALGVLLPIVLGAAELLMIGVLADLTAGAPSIGARPPDSGAAADVRTSTPTPTRPRRVWLILSILVAVPLTMQLDLARSSGSSQTVRMPLVDPLIWFAVALELLEISRACLRIGDPRGRIEYLRRETLGGVDPLFALLPLVAMLSLAASTVPLEGLKDFVQMLDTYVLFCWWITRQLRGVSDYRWLGAGLGIFFAVMTAASLWQILLGTPLYLIRSFFPDHPSLVAATVLLAPLTWCALQAGTTVWVRMIAFLLVGMGSVVSGTLLTPVLVVGQLLVAGAVSRRKWLGHSAAFLAMALVSWLVLPADYQRALLAEPGSWVKVPLSERRSEVLNAKRFQGSFVPQLHFPAGPWHAFTYVSVDAWARSATRPTRTDANEPDLQVFQEYYASSWSALGLLGRNPVLGTGVGSWEEKIGTGYGVLERTGTTFPNTLNGYLLLAVTLGMLGLTAWLLIMGRSLREARDHALGGGAAGRGWIATGALAGLVGSSVAMVCCPIATLPLGVYWVLLARAVQDGPARGVTRS